MASYTPLEIIRHKIVADIIAALCGNGSRGGVQVNALSQPQASTTIYFDVNDTVEDPTTHALTTTVYRSVFTITLDVLS